MWCNEGVFFMGIGVFILAVIVVIYRAISSEMAVKNLAEYEKWNDPNYDKIEQDRIFDYYLKHNPRCHEQEFLTTWELYQKAQMELKSKGYKWNPAWDEYTPSPDKKEYVKGTRKYREEYERLHHRKGENKERQKDIFAGYLCNWEWDSEHKMYWTSKGDNSLYINMTQYEIYEFVKAAYNGQILTKYKNNENFVKAAERIRYGYDWINDKLSDKHLNKYNESNVWYDDLMPFIPKKDFVPYPSEEYMKTHRIDWHEWHNTNEEMWKATKFGNFLKQYNLMYKVVKEVMQL